MALFLTCPVSASPLLILHVLHLSSQLKMVNPNAKSIIAPVPQIQTLRDPPETLFPYIPRYRSHHPAPLNDRIIPRPCMRRAFPTPRISLNPIDHFSVVCHASAYHKVRRHFGQSVRATHLNMSMRGVRGPTEGGRPSGKQEGVRRQLDIPTHQTAVARVKA